MRTRLARAYIAHKAELNLSSVSDERIVDLVDDITTVLLGSMKLAQAQRFDGWSKRYAGSWPW